MSDVVRQTIQLGNPWQTIDPFLFCVHHVDAYPAGNGRFGPAATLAGRELGSDFAGVDGWNMYHGREIPGFPPHPHRGFETVTYVRRGLVDHSDSLGAAARFGRGDTQWLTAGNGIVHAEMFPLANDDAPNPLELFQIWVNLASEDKTADPHFTIMWGEDTPRLREVGADGAVAEVTVIAGPLAGAAAPSPPPPHSWAARADADVAIWHVHLDPEARWTMPPAASAETVRTLYVFGGGALSVDGTDVADGVGAVVRPDVAIELASAAGTEVLVLQGRPIGEPVAQYGPFVLNDRAGIERAFADYRRTGFGGWPWPTDEPVHADAPGRFARYPDGRIEHPADASAREAEVAAR